MSLKEDLEETLGIKIDEDINDLNYDAWLELFRKVPAERISRSKAWLASNLPVEGYAAASRWMEIIENPTKMDKLYKGRLKASEKESIMDLAVGDDDEAFYEALIRENVEKLDESRNSAQEVARITQNLNIFRMELRDIRSRKPKEGSVLAKVLELSAKAPKAPQKASTKATKKKTRGGTKSGSTRRRKSADSDSKLPKS